MPASRRSSLGQSASSVVLQPRLSLLYRPYRSSAAEHLRDCGYRVIEAGDGDEAIEVLQADDRIDIVFSDVQMPNRTGLIWPNGFVASVRP